MTPEEIRKECESYEKKENIMFHVAIGLFVVAMILSGIYGYQRGDIGRFFLIIDTLVWIFFFFMCDKLKD